MNKLEDDTECVRTELLSASGPAGGLRHCNTCRWTVD